VKAAVKVMVVAVCAALCMAAVANDKPMSVKQMEGLKGVRLLDKRLNEVFDTCGLSAAIGDRGKGLATERTATWKGSKMSLTDENWDVVYGRTQGGKPVPNGWINPKPTDSSCTAGLAGLVLYSEGKVGFLKIDRQARKTTYTVPDDPYKAHKVIGLMAYLAAEIPATEVTAKYGAEYESVVDEDGNKVLRYWVVVREGLLPVYLYAVDFHRSNSGRRVYAYAIRSKSFEFVSKKLRKYEEEWEKWAFD